MFQKMFQSFCSACGKAVIHIEGDCQIGSLKEMLFQLGAYIAQIEANAVKAQAEAQAQKPTEDKPVEAPVVAPKE